jgi:AmmeMemoRadiSam system protein A
MPSINLCDADKKILLKLAYDSIAHGLSKGSAISVNTHEYAELLQQPGASFVTLHKHGELRGCIGALEAYQPLVNDVAEHAFAAAFQDPRFPAVEQSELPLLDIEISVLGKPETIQFTSEQDLLAQIRPGIDGLILESGYHRGTFLPSVWEQLPEPEDFLKHLKIKAGLPANWWQNDVRISRYETLSFS